MLKIAITGATGLIGTRLVELLSNQFEFIPLLQEEIDITQREVLWQALKNINFDFFLHLAAYTDVDGAEKHKELAEQVNVSGTKNVFEINRRLRKKFIYVSTGFVFNGKKEQAPFTESSLPDPISFYGLTKYEGEKIVKNQAMIIRLDYPYGKSAAQKKDFVHNIIVAFKEGKTLKMVENSTITPTPIDDFVAGLQYLINNYSPEIFHLVGQDSWSPYAIGQMIARNFRFSPDLIEPIAYNSYFKNRAKRPQFSTIKSIKNDFILMKSFADGLKLL